MIDWFIINVPKEKIYNVTSGAKIDLLTLANLVNEVNDYKSDIRVLNDGLNNEYTSSNEKVLKEIGKISFTTHKEAIRKMKDYFSCNLKNLDTDTIFNDPYLKEINKMWNK